MRNTFNNSGIMKDRRYPSNSPHMLDSNSSIPSTTLNMSFLPGAKGATMLSSNKPISNKVVMMPHLANKNIYRKEKVTFRNN